MIDIHAKLSALGLELPAAPKPAAIYVPCVQSGNQLFISGQLPSKNGDLLYQGTVPGDVSVEDAQKAAEQCTLNAIAVLDAYIESDWTRFSRFVKVGGFVACDAPFAEQSVVINGASDLLEKIFGEKGRHARAAVGSSALPKNAPVEIEFVVELAG